MAILQKTESRTEPVGGEELERQIVEKRLQRIADKRAEHKKDESDELPVMSAPPKMGANKPSLSPLPKHGGDLPPILGSANVQDEANLQTLDEERDA